MQHSNFLTNRRISTLILIGALLTVCAMLMHPHGISDKASQIHLMRWVHASLMLILLLNTLGMIQLIDALGRIESEFSLVLIFYYLGVASFLFAALISGFVQTSLIEFYPLDSEAFSNLNKFAVLFNQALAKLGVSTFGAAAVLLFLSLYSSNGTLRLVAITSGVVGVALIVSMLSGLNLSITTMTILSSLIAIWHCSIALWLLNN